MEYLDNASHLTLWRGFPGNPDVQRGARNAVTHLRLRQIAQLQNMLLTGLLHCIPIAGEALDMAKLAAATTIGIKGVSLLLDSTLSLSILDSDIATAAAMISFTTSMCSLHRFRDYDIKKSLKLVAIITIWGACLGKGKAGLAQGGLIGLAGLMGAAVRERLEYNIDEQRLLTIGYLTLGQITTALALALIFVTKPEKSGTWTHQRQNMLKLAKDLSRSAAIGGVVSLINNTCPTRFFSRDAFKRETPGVILLGMLLAHIIKF
jgi:hypothetical protein